VQPLAPVDHGEEAEKQRVGPCTAPRVPHLTLRSAATRRYASRYAEAIGEQGMNNVV
jgi:hypothetical protein